MRRSKYILLFAGYVSDYLYFGVLESKKENKQTNNTCSWADTTLGWIEGYKFGLGVEKLKYLSSVRVVVGLFWAEHFSILRREG